MIGELLFSWSGRTQLVLPLIVLGLWAGVMALLYGKRRIPRVLAFSHIGMVILAASAAIHSYSQLRQVRVWDDRIEYAKGDDAHVARAGEIVKIISSTSNRGGRHTYYFVRGGDEGREMPSVMGSDLEQEYRLALEKFCQRNRIPFEWYR